MHSVLLRRLSSSFYRTIPATSIRQQHSDWSKEHFQVAAEKQWAVWLSIASRAALSLDHVSFGAGLWSHFVRRWLRFHLVRQWMASRAALGFDCISLPIATWSVCQSSSWLLSVLEPHL